MPTSPHGGQRPGVRRPSDLSPEAVAWAHAWLLRLEHHREEAYGEATKDRRRMSRWQAERDQLAAECNTPDRWLAVWSQWDAATDRQRQHLCTWLSAHTTPLPTTPRRGGSAAVMRAVANALLTSLPTYGTDLHAEAAARWIRAFAAHGRPPEKTLRGRQALQTPPTTATEDQPLTWRDVTPAQRARMITRAAKMYSGRVGTAIMAAFPMEDLGLDTHWGPILMDAWASTGSKRMSRAQVEADPRMQRWFYSIGTTASVWTALFERPDWMPDGVAWLAASRGGSDKLGMIPGVVEPPVAVLRKVIRDQQVYSGNILAHVIRLGRDPKHSGRIHPQLLEDLIQWVGRENAAAPTWKEFAQIMLPDGLTALLEEPGVVARLDDATRRRLLVEGPTELKVRVWGALADERRAEAATPQPAKTARGARTR